MAQLEEHPLARDISTCRVARELGLSIQEVEKAAVLFKAACSDDPVTADSVLTSKQLESVLCAQANVSATHELPAGLLETTSKAIANQDGVVKFDEFTRWYHAIFFVGELFLDQRTLWIRNLAKKHDIGLVEIDGIKSIFDSFDEDGSGMIDFEEFRILLGKLLETPPDLEMPLSRIKHFWLEIDHDQSGQVDFEEFLVFYSRYFARRKDSGDRRSLMEDFYSGLGSSERFRTNTASWRDAKKIGVISR